MLTFEQIYDSIPFEDEQGNIIPHDKVAKEAAEKWAEQFTEVNNKDEKLRYKIFSTADDMVEWANSKAGTDYIISIEHHNDLFGIYFIK